MTHRWKMGTPLGAEEAAETWRTQVSDLSEESSNCREEEEGYGKSHLVNKRALSSQHIPSVFISFLMSLDLLFNVQNHEG